MEIGSLVYRPHREHKIGYVQAVLPHDDPHDNMVEVMWQDEVTWEREVELNNYDVLVDSAFDKAYKLATMRTDFEEWLFNRK